MSFGSLLDHILRRPIQATAAVGAETTDMEIGKKPKGGSSFYLQFFLKDKPAFAGFIMIGVFLAWSLIEGIMQTLGALLHDQAIGWALLPSNPFALPFASKLLPPSLSHFPNQLFGTNLDGQSLFSRLLYAAPHDAEAPIIIVGSAIIIGMFLGGAAGYFGGWIDEISITARTDPRHHCFSTLGTGVHLSNLRAHGYLVAHLCKILQGSSTYA
jgi:ABC-type dipeptide/oligopeptide/nickel transport system permease subunit